LATCINNSLVEESTNCWSENADKENNQDFLSHDEENEEYNEDDLPENIENFDDRKWSKALYMFVVNLAYLEAPQYLRRILFKMNPLLRMAGLQNPLDAPHHVRADEWISYRFKIYK
jgi:methyltransferase